MVLAANSPYFEKALKNPLVEGSSRVFHFNEGSVHAYWRVFQFMYFGKYTDEPRKGSETGMDNSSIPTNPLNLR